MADSSPRALVRTMSCLTISTQNPAALCDLLGNSMGWTLRSAGPITPAMAQAWGVGGLESAHFALYGSEGSDRGMIRVIPGEDRFPSRQIGARWSGAEIVVMEDIDGLYETLVARPDFTADIEPDDADFSDVGANVHRFFYGRPSCGTHIMYTAEVTECRDYEFPRAPAPVGYIFSIPLVTTEFARVSAVLRDVLGMVPTLEDKLDGGIWHKTWKLDEGTPVDLAVIKGDAEGFGEGSIELQGYPERVVDVVPFNADRFDGGSCLGTYVATDFDAAYERLKDEPSIEGCTAPVVIDPAPYSGGRSFTIILPGGARLEIVERFDG